MKYKLENEVREQVVEGLLARVEIDLPESIVEDRTREIVFNLVTENQRRGVPKEVIEKEKDTIYTAANTAAKNRVKATIIFAKIAEKEGIKVEQNDIIPRVQQIAMENRVSVDEVVRELKKNNRIPALYEDAINSKVVDFLVKNAQIEEVPAEEGKDSGKEEKAS